MQPRKVRPAQASEPGARITPRASEDPAAPLPAPPGPRILFVARTGLAHFRSISAAIAAAEPNTRIVVRPGVYSERLVLDRRVLLIGEGPVETIVVVSVGSSCVHMRT